MIQASLTTLVLITQSFIVLLIAYLLYTKIKGKKQDALRKYLSERALPLTLIIATIATLGSLYYSEILGLNPCPLCWYQRIFMYPLVFISATAIITKAKNAKAFILPLSITGALIAIYHYLLQAFAIPIACGPGAVTCDVIYFAAYGYITIPLMAFTAFTLITLLLLIKRK